LRLAAIGALVVVFAQAGLLAALAQALVVDDARWPMAALLGSTVGAAGLARIAVAIVTIAAVVALGQAPAAAARRALLLGSSVLLAGSGALASHAMGRLDGQASLLLVSALHQVAVGVWVGGLACAALIALHPANTDTAWLRPFSTVALAAVAGIAVTGLALTLAYVGSAGAAIGTSYGAMVLTKVVLFAALLAMGA
jgi:putative copper export protein